MVPIAQRITLWKYMDQNLVIRFLTRKLNLLTKKDSDIPEFCAVILKRICKYFTVCDFLSIDQNICTLFFNSTQSCLTLPRHNLYLVYLCPYLGLGLLMSYLCGIFFIFSLIFTVTNHITSLKQTPLSFCTFFRISPIIFWMITWMNKVNNFQMEKVQPQGVAQLLLDFLPISVWRCYKSVAYRQKSM